MSTNKMSRILFLFFVTILFVGLAFSFSGCGTVNETSPVASPTATASTSATATASASPTATASASPTATASASPTATASASPTATASASPTPIPTTYSISGKAIFYSTTDGIRDGVTIAISGEGATHVTTTEVNAGTYEVTGLPAGEYHIFGYKDGWTISNINATIDASSLTSQNITAELTDWTASYIGGGNADIMAVDYDVSRMVAIGSSSGAQYYISTNSGETWTEYPQSVITTETISYSSVHMNSEGSIELGDTVGRFWILDAGATSGWYFDGEETLEAGVSFKVEDGINQNNSGAIGNNGIFYFSVDAGDTFVRCDTAGSGLNWLTTFNNGVLVVGDNGFINYLADGSTTPEASDWLSKNLASSNTNVMSVVTADDDDSSVGARLVLVSTSRGEIFYSYPKVSDNWINWLSGIPYSLNAMSGVAPSTSITDMYGMMVFGDNGLILKRD